jgi:hypothetical protein
MVPGSQAALRGALVTVDPRTLVPSVIAFQYNPHTLTRSFEVQGAAGGPESGQLTGPPAESIQVELVLDAADAAEVGESPDGVAPQIAALLGLITPSSASARAALDLAAAGSLEVLPPAGPITLFVWGAKRVLPVAIVDMSISEEAHDAQLNPVLARVSLGLRVLTYADLAASHPGHALSLASQVAREELASGAVTASTSGVLGADVPVV